MSPLRSLTESRMKLSLARPILAVQLIAEYLSSSRIVRQK
jgi:hypothetical protein